jgi:hypothetical protein
VCYRENSYAAADAVCTSPIGRAGLLNPRAGLLCRAGSDRIHWYNLRRKLKRIPTVDVYPARDDPKPGGGLKNFSGTLETNANRSEALLALINQINPYLLCVQEIAQYIDADGLKHSMVDLIREGARFSHAYYGETLSMKRLYAGPQRFDGGRAVQRLVGLV